MSTCVITTKVFPFTIEYFAAVYAKEELLRLLGKETKIILNSQIDFVIPNEILNSLPKSTDTLLENSNEVIEIKKVKESCILPLIWQEWKQYNLDQRISGVLARLLIFALYVKAGNTLPANDDEYFMFQELRQIVGTFAKQLEL